MNIKPTIKLRVVKRLLYVMVAALLAVATVPLLHGGNASADQLQFRSIQLSDASPSGNSNITTGIGSGTAVTYQISFTTGALSSSSMVIDFCSNDPIIGDSCTAPTGMSVKPGSVTPTLNATAQHGTIDTAHNWTVTATDTPGTTEQIKLADDDPTGGSDDMAASTNQIFDLVGITNPSAADCATSAQCSFYARIYTYHNSNAYGGVTVGVGYTGPSGNGPGLYNDYGGVALSTSTVITITARVQETLTFCVSASSPNAWTTTGDCSDSGVTAPNIIIGHGSPTAVLDNNHIDTQAVFSQLSTNATNGAVINLHNSNTCGGLSSDHGTTCLIPPISKDNTVPNEGVPIAGGAGLSTPTTIAAFGLNVEPFTATTPPSGSTGAIVPSTYYYNASHNNTTNVGTTTPPDLWYGMDNTTASGLNATPSPPPPTVDANTYTGSVGGAFGSTVASTTGPVYDADAEYIFAATAALTTPAGIYQANLSLIATGSF